MFCPKCGRMNSDEDINCKGCGALLHEEEAAAPKKKNRKGIFIAAAAVVIAAAVCAAGISSCDADTALIFVTLL